MISQSQKLIKTGQAAARSSIEVSESGLVTALFTNGESKPIYQLAVGTVPAASQLDALSGNAYQVNSSSGDLVLSIPGEAALGPSCRNHWKAQRSISRRNSRSLIVTQRAYSAATKILTTGDEMLDEIIRVKR